MPRGDRTGPWGGGPMTGRGAGYCGGYPAPGFASAPGGPPASWGSWGGGRGWRHGFHATGLPFWARTGFAGPTPDQEQAALKAQAEWLTAELEAINKRIQELEPK